MKGKIIMKKLIVFLIIFLLLSTGCNDFNNNISIDETDNVISNDESEENTMNTNYELYISGVKAENNYIYSYKNGKICFAFLPILKELGAEVIQVDNQISYITLLNKKYTLNIKLNSFIRDDGEELFYNQNGFYQIIDDIYYIDVGAMSYVLMSIKAHIITDIESNKIFIAFDDIRDATLVIEDRSINEFVKINLDKHCAELPVVTVVKLLGGNIEWVDDHTAHILIYGNKYILDINEQMMIIEGDAHEDNLLSVPPGSYAHFQVTAQNLVVDSFVLDNLFYLFGVKIQIDYVNLIIYLQ